MFWNGPRSMTETPMPAPADIPQAPNFTRTALDNSIWYGSALITTLARGETTGGHYSLLAWRLARGFAPPPHRHGPEDFYITRGVIRFWVADRELVAVGGDLRSHHEYVAHLSG